MLTVEVALLLAVEVGFAVVLFAVVAFFAVAAFRLVRGVGAFLVVDAGLAVAFFPGDAAALVAVVPAVFFAAEAVDLVADADLAVAFLAVDAVALVAEAALVADADLAVAFLVVDAATLAVVVFLAAVFLAVADLAVLFLVVVFLADVAFFWVVDAAGLASPFCSEVAVLVASSRSKSDKLFFVAINFPNPA
ncbi:hypothetical protein [Acaryochloris sp. IP29b_bin.137]|uniref:hypothetical protein n=1 Tax=Acaryochloris sp. IP29b_bin.137 TaxID=2969217 RepID=UPI00260A50AB|nr:hypothetical protein [Acaryochloris sp. IP29b_bin.137]